MAEVNNAQVIGNFTSRVTAESSRDSTYGKLLAADRAVMGGAPHASLHEFPAALFPWSLYRVTDVAAASAANTCRVKAPRPLTIWAIDIGCETAPGATGTGDVYTDDGTTDASVLDAAVDVKTAAGTCTRTAPEDGSEDVAYGTEIYARFASGAGDVLTGGQAHLYCQWQ